MRAKVIVVTNGDSLLMEGVEAGLRARGVPVSRQGTGQQSVAIVSGDRDETVVVFDQDELSCEEVAYLGEGVHQGSGTLLGLNRASGVAVRYRVERVVLTGLRDLLPSGGEGSEVTVSV